MPEGMKLAGYRFRRDGGPWKLIGFKPNLNPNYNFEVQPVYVTAEDAARD